MDERVNILGPVLTIIKFLSILPVWFIDHMTEIRKQIMKTKSEFSSTSYYINVEFDTKITIIK